MASVNKEKAGNEVGASSNPSLTDAKTPVPLKPKRKILKKPQDENSVKSKKAGIEAEGSSGPSPSDTQTQGLSKPIAKVLKNSLVQGSVKNSKADNEAKDSSTPSPSEPKTPESLKPKATVLNKPSEQKSGKKRVIKVIRRVIKKKPKIDNDSRAETDKEKSGIGSQRNDESEKKLQEQNGEEVITDEKENNEKNQRDKDNKEKSGITDQRTDENEKRPQEQNIEKKITCAKGNTGKNRMDHSNKEKTYNKESQELKKGITATNEGHVTKHQKDHKDKGKIGGLILMCNGKTKPDCFRYGVMGVSLKRKESVLDIKPGLKLFLYDFDLKLLYGIYRASSAGGMKLEPNAFGGSFPAQVRFKVDKDCYPLEENTFKKAIKDNYKDKQRFKNELTVQQANDLSDLFRPVQSQASNVHPVIHDAPPVLAIHPPIMPHFPAGGNLERKESVPPQAYRESITKDPYSLDKDIRIRMLSDYEQLHLPSPHESYRMPSDLERYHTSSNHEREQLPRHPSSTRKEVTSTEEDTFSKDPLFLSEKEYRTYGLARARPTRTPPVTISSSDLNQKDHSREQLRRYSASRQRQSPPIQEEELSSDPLFLSEKAYRTYGLGRERRACTPPAPDPSAPTPYLAHYGESSDPYFLNLRTEATSSSLYLPSTRGETHMHSYDYPEKSTTGYTRNRRTNDNSLMGLSDEQERLLSTYASTALSDYNQRQHVYGSNADFASGSVASRYSFGGPSMSYR